LGIDEKSESGSVAGSPHRGQTGFELIRCAALMLV
jgi:hypothetical protein